MVNINVYVEHSLMVPAKQLMRRGEERRGRDGGREGGREKGEKEG